MLCVSPVRRRLAAYRARARERERFHNYRLKLLVIEEYCQPRRSDVIVLLRARVISGHHVYLTTRNKRFARTREKENKRSFRPGKTVDFYASQLLM